MVTTDRLILSPMALSDAPFIFELVNSETYIQNIGNRDVHSILDAEEYIQLKMIEHFEEHGYGNYLVTRIADNIKLGCVSLYNREDVEGIDVGFAFLPEHTGQGYAYEGARAIMNHAKNEFNISEICAFTSKENVASQKLIKKLGLTFSKTILFGAKNEELLYYTNA